MKKLIITDTINFIDDVKNIHDLKLWEGRPHGIYEVTHMMNEQRVSQLVMWGIDANFLNSPPIVISMPFPTVAVFERQDTAITEEHIPPRQFVEFEGSHITGDVLLKAIAIAQNPELAKDLL